MAFQSLSVTAFAAVENSGFSDVDAGAWYAEAVTYCRKHGPTNKTSSTIFEPESSLTCTGYGPQQRSQSVDYLLLRCQYHQAPGRVYCRIGYPIWRGQAPRIVSTFFESYDFGGKTIVPFCTSGSSGIGSSARNLHSLTDGATWLDGQRFGGGTSRSAIIQWVNGLGLDVTVH